MDRNEIIEAVHGILTEGFEIEPELLQTGALLRDDLGLDSLDAVDLVVAIEKRFGIRIQEAEARQMRTIDDIYGYVDRLLEARGDGA